MHDAESTGPRETPTQQGWLHLVQGDQTATEPASVQEPNVPGRWALAHPKRTAEAPALTWRERVSVAALTKRSIALPAAAAIALFVVASLVTLLLIWEQPGEATAPFVESEQSASAGGGVITENEGTGQPESLLAVHVVGEVEQPGVVELPQGSRVLDAMAAAGGATATAVLTDVNLARLVIDGEQIVVPNLEQSLASAAAVSDQSQGGGATSGGDAPLVSLNTANESDFETLPRVGPALAARIIEWRKANGGFRTIDQLGEVSGIGDKTLESLKPLVTL
ncbi:helix-hairpin-helix domain-containing protein [Leucobacter sp. cx-42]|nr:helix-hairpin-helix domain-containing protein [Leucobacter sp. cx-42]